MLYALEKFEGAMLNICNKKEESGHEYDVFRRILAAVSSARVYGLVFQTLHRINLIGVQLRRLRA
jgi:hypothetical protein